MNKIFTLKHFLKIFRIWLPLFYMVILLPVAYSQDRYELTLSDTSTFDNDGCGKITAATWTVKDDSCVLFTPYFRKETLGTTVVLYNFRVNQNGAGDTNDVAYIQLQRNLGEWVTDTLVHAQGLNNVDYTLSGSLSVVYGETVRFKAVLITDSHQDFWSIFSGSSVTGSFETYSGWPPPLASLPVELDYFTGIYFNNAFVLKWATFSEVNCDYYNVERSIDGVNYETIAFIDGAGCSNEYFKYAYIDENDIAEEIVYYRLRQVDVNGKFEYFGPVAVYNHERLCVNISPIPAETFSPIFVSFPNAQNDITRVQVFNDSGQQLINSCVYGEDFAFVVSEPGFYIVAVTSGNHKVSYNKIAVR